MKCASATPMGSGVPPARSDWWHAKSRHALLRSRIGLRQSVVAPRLWSVRLVSSASAKRMAVEQIGIPMRPPLGASCEWGYVEWRAAGASQPSADVVDGVDGVPLARASRLRCRRWCG